MTAQRTPKSAKTWALLSLAIGSFGIGMTEFVTMGLLPDIAQNLLPELWALSQEDAIAKAGWMISLYALGVVCGAPTIAALVARFPRHRVMIALATALLLSNLLAVVLPSFELVAASRFLAGLPHGAYFGIAALVASDILGPGKRGKGIAFVLTGLTLANVVGVPLGTFLGQQWGWRAAFLVVAVIFATSVVCIARFVPSGPGDAGRTLRAELRAFRIPQVWLTIAVGAIGFGGFFAVYSYIAPVVTEISGSPEWAVPIVVMVVGVGMTVGNIVGGYLADRHLVATLIGGLLGMALMLALFALTAQAFVSLLVFAFAIGATSSATVPAFQTRLIEVAGESQSLAAALNHSALNVGNTLGAMLGGTVIALGWGFLAPTWVGVALAVVGVGLVGASLIVQRRTRIPITG